MAFLEIAGSSILSGRRREGGRNEANVDRRQTTERTMVDNDRLLLIISNILSFTRARPQTTAAADIHLAPRILVSKSTKTNMNLLLKRKCQQLMTKACVHP
jgi:hypothetical protein